MIPDWKSITLRFGWTALVQRKARTERLRAFFISGTPHRKQGPWHWPRGRKGAALTGKPEPPHCLARRESDKRRHPIDPARDSVSLTSRAADNLHYALAVWVRAHRSVPARAPTQRDPQVIGLGLPYSRDDSERQSNASDRYSVSSGCQSTADSPAGWSFAGSFIPWSARSSLAFRR